MCLAHFGVGVFILGATMVSAYTVEDDLAVRPGDRVEVGGYEIQFNGVRTVEGPNYVADEGEFQLRKNGELVETVTSQQRLYRVQQSSMTEAAIDSRIGRDVFIALRQSLGDDAWAIRVAGEAADPLSLARHAADGARRSTRDYRSTLPLARTRHGARRREPAARAAEVR